MTSRRAATLLLLIALPELSCLAASPPDSLQAREGFVETEGPTPRKAIATGLAGALIMGSLVESYYAWWKGSTGPFAFRAEGWFGPPHLGIDKLGHLYTSYFYFHTLRNLLLWGGYRTGAATLWSAGIASFFALSVEVGDGVSEYAFDYQDLLFNAAGLGYGLLQTEVPALRNFTLKWSYVPAEGYRFPPRFTEHYDGHIYWLAVNVNALLPEDLEPFWPDPLQVAGGYSVGGGVTRREYVLALDLRLSVFDPPQPEAKLLLRTADLFHLPLPGVKLTPAGAPEYRIFLKN